MRHGEAGNPRALVVLKILSQTVYQSEKEDMIDNRADTLVRTQAGRVERMLPVDTARHMVEIGRMLRGLHDQTSEQCVARSHRKS